MRSTTFSAGFDPHFARQRTGYRVAARRGATASWRLQGGRYAVACSRANAVAPRRSAEQILARAPGCEPAKPAASEAIARRVLIAIRVAIGLVFVACGLSGFIDFAPAHAGTMQAGTMHGGAMAFGGALLLAGSLLPLLKGTEVIVETMLDLQRALSTRRSS